MTETENESESESRESGAVFGEYGFGTTIETARLHMRAPQLSDAEAITGLVNNEKIAKNLGRVPYPYVVQNATGWISGLPEHPEDVIFAITLKETGVLIGIVSLERMRPGEPLRLGYWLGEPFWGSGYMTEAAHAVVDFAFSRTDMARISSDCRVTNPTSRAVLSKCGFQYVGTGMSKSLFFKGMVPIDEFSLDRATWQGLKNWHSSHVHAGSRNADGKTIAGPCGCGCEDAA